MSGSNIITTLLIIVSCSHFTRQECPQEVLRKGIRVTWLSSPEGINIRSKPTCFTKNDSVVVRNCTNDTWSPPLTDLKPCVRVMNNWQLSSCPPGYYGISNNNPKYCIQVSEPSIWDYPCLKSGGATVITDLNDGEVNSLKEILNRTRGQYSRYYWLPAQRKKVFNPITWMIPGPNWGKLVGSNHPSLPLQASLFKNCLLLDTQDGIMSTGNCNKIYPSLCVYINDAHYPSKCPNQYQAYRFMPSDGVCFGIEYTDTSEGLSFNEFQSTKCKKPMGDNQKLKILSYIYKTMANSLYNMNENRWCWFISLSEKNNSDLIYFPEDTTDNNLTIREVGGVINTDGKLGIMPINFTLSCMACEMDMIYSGTELAFEYNELDSKMYLTIYFPSGLWRYDTNDKGVRCFSNAKGFSNRVQISKLSYADSIENFNETDIDKVIYIVEPISDRMAEYWCEGHTKNFSLISTNRIVVNPQGDSEHVFVMCIMIDNNVDGDFSMLPDFSEISDQLSILLNARKAVIMDILEFLPNDLLLVVHLYVILDEDTENMTQNLQKKFQYLSEKAMIELPKHNMSLVNISSPIYCLPTQSENIISLDWELTLLGQFTAPQQFCLQANGLPVKRRCEGSYLMGALWGPVEGTCDTSYKPSNTTAFLYNFVAGKTSENHTTRFLTDGLHFVLKDTDIIIPADIYYLSVSLKHLTVVAHENKKFVDMGDLHNMAWAVDRLMTLNQKYLSLAQTLNSTNMILDSVTDIIEMLAIPNNTNTIENVYVQPYQLAVKPQFLTQVSYPFINNITGVALIKKNESDMFTEFKVQTLFRNTTLNDVLAIKDLDIATWVPEIVLRTLKPNLGMNSSNEINATLNSELHIMINIFHNDAIFQEIHQHTRHQVDSRIVEISIPGYSSNLIYSIPIIFKHKHASNSEANNNLCGFWDFEQYENESIPGYWNKKGCFFVDQVNNLTICRCYHLTHFAQLITLRNRSKGNITDGHMKALNIITLIGSFLSLLGIAGIWVTAIVFSVWRQKAGTKVLLQLSSAIALPLIIIVIFSLDNTIFMEYDGMYYVVEHMKGVCIILGAFLHYSILVGFVWMLMTAVLQFVRYVRVIGVQRPSRFMMKLTVIGWGLPLFPIIIVLAINMDTYLPIPTSSASYYGPICYPNGTYFLLGVLLPVVIIIIANILLFISVIIAISKGPNGKIRSVDVDLVKAQLRLSIFLFFLLGLTWIFGIFSFSKNMTWSYMFCLTSTLQGFVLFLYFVVCDPATRNLWTSLMKPQFRMRSPRDSIVSTSFERHMR